MVLDIYRDMLYIGKKWRGFNLAICSNLIKNAKIEIKRVNLRVD